VSGKIFSGCIFDKLYSEYEIWFGMPQHSDEIQIEQMGVGHFKIFEMKAAVNSKTEVV